MLRRYFWWLVIVVSLLGCGDEGPSDPPVDDDEEDEVQQGSQALILAAGRKVDVKISGRSETWLAENADKPFKAACILEAIKRPWVTPPTQSSPTAYSGQCPSESPAILEDSPAFLANLYVQRRDLVAQVHLCVAQMTLEVAESPVPKHLVAVSSGIEFVEEIPEGARVVFSVGAPKASDAGTWALIAADYFRLAAENLALVLTNCPTALANDTAHLFDGVQYNTTIATQLGDSLTSMIEAAEKAKEFVSAAAQAKQSNKSGDDPLANKLDAWLARHDSRLEAASIFVPVHAGLYGRKTRALYEMINTTTGSAAGSYYYTANPNTPLAGFERSKRADGSLVPPLGYGLSYIDGAAAPRMAGTVKSYKKSDNTSRSWSTAGTGWSVTTTAPDWVHAYGGPQANLELVPCKLWETTATTGIKKYRWLRKGTRPEGVPPGTPVGTGWAELSGTGSEMWLFPYDTGSPDYPLVTADVSGEGPQRALELMRVLRIDPRVGIPVGAIAAGATQPPARTAADVLEDLRRALIEEYGTVYDRPVAAVIEELGLTDADIEVAARRLVEESRALGLPLVDDPAYDRIATAPASFESKRVFGTNDPLAATHPAILYARTAGFWGAMPHLMPEATAYAEPDAVYAKSSITATLDFVRSALTDADGRYKRTMLASMAPKATTQFQLTLQKIKTHLGPRTRVGFDTGAGAVLPLVDGVRIYFQGLGLTTVNDAKDKIDIWQGEAGLECVLLGSVGGKPCTPETYQYEETPPTTSDADWSIDSQHNELQIRLHRLQAPGDNLRIDVPIFVTRKSGRGVQILTGFYPDAPSAAQWDWLYMPPYSDWLTGNLSELLAVDPDDPGEADIDCVGLKTKLTLEDELTEGQTGKDGIESSYAYYLKAAADAAEKADKLGDDLVEQGLQMDIRAEIARAELEDLCGGVVNLESIGEQACAADCDIAKTLMESTETADNNASLKSCLVPEEFNTDLSLGSNPLCVYQIDGKEPCVGKYKQKTDNTLVAPACPVLLEGTKEEHHMDGSAYEVPKICSDMFPQKATMEPVAFTPMMALGKVPLLEPDPKQSPSECKRLLGFVAGNKAIANGWQFTYTNEDLRAVANMVSMDVDQLGNSIVERMGAPWLKARDIDPQTGAVTNNTTQFPCAKLDGKAWNIPPELITEMCMNAPAGSQPLFCGMSCLSPALVNERLEKAVLTLRYMAGVPLKGVMHSIESSYLTNKHAWYRGRDLNDIWTDDSTDDADEEFAAGTLPFYEIQGFVADAGPLAIFTELATLIGTPTQRRDHVNNDWFEFISDLGGLTYGPAITVGGRGVETGTFSFKGLLTEGGSGTLICDTACQRVVIDGHMRDMLDKNDHRYAGTPSRAIVDWGAIAVGNLKSVHAWTAPTAYSWNGAVNQRWSYISKGMPVPADGSAKFIFPRPVGDPGTRYAGALTRSDVMDALQIACLAQHPPESMMPTCEDLKTTETNGMLSVDGLRDYGRVSKALSCKANELLRYAAKQYIQDAPKDVAEALQKNATANIYPDNKGALALALTDFMSALNGVLSAVNSMAKIVGDSSNAVASAENQMRALGYKHDIALESAAAQIAQQEANCVAAKINAIPDVSVNISSQPSASISPTGILKNGLMAAATCSNAGAQKAHIETIKALEGKVELAEETGVLLDLQDKLSELSLALDETNRAFLEQHAKMQSAVAQIQSVRQKAMRAAATALLLDSDEMGHEFNATTTMHARFNTLQARYTQAVQDAKKLAYLARRAIEQKVGMDLSKLTEPLPLVDAPSSWVNTLCERGGINYDDVRSNTGDDDTSNDENGYAEQYVGDYVRKLENFLESYRLAYPFQDGDDLAVVSVRDEIIGSRAACDAEGWNGLLYTDGASFGNPERPEDGWEKTCSLDAGRRAWLLPGGPGPFQCVKTAPTGPSDSTAMLCNSLGSAQAFSLSTVAADSCDPEDSGAADRSEPPTEQLAYWISADACTETVAGNGVLSTCTDRSGNGRTLTGTANSATLIASSIGGKPAINTTGTWSVPKLPAATDRFTVSYVVRPLGTGTKGLWRAIDNQTDGSARDAYLYHDGNLVATFLMQPNTGSTLPMAIVSANTGGAPPQLSASGSILTIRANGSEGVEMYVNGKRWADTSLAAYAMKLGGQVVQGTATAPVLFAETLAYSKALTEAELDDLHGYLAARYGIAVNLPDAWLEADDLNRMRTGTGNVSSVSGYVGDATGIFDRASGKALTRNGNVSTLVPFANGHFGVDFDGVDDFAGWTTFGGACNRPNASTGSCIAEPREHVSEYAVTLVARYANVQREHVLYYTGSTARLVANATNGTITVRVSKPAGTETYTSPNGIVAPDVPFIVTLRGSASRGRTDVFVNGVKQLSWPGFEYEAATRYLGRVGGDWLRGSIAEAQVHARNLSDAAVGAVQTALGAKYSIVVTAVSPTGDVASGGRARIRQWAPALNGYTYMFSWYQPDADTALRPIFDMGDGTIVTAGEPSSIRSCGATTPPPANCEQALHPKWKRLFTTITANQDGWMAVGLPTPTTVGTTQLVAAPQLEDAPANMSIGPLPFFPTDDDLMKPVGQCEDSTGENFRTMWHRGCEYYCPPGTGRTCTAINSLTTLPQRCFWELNFKVMLEDIERGALIPEAGFALGNFNYRFDEVAVNLVGTGIKNCELSDNPSACYANNHLPYSLHHDGPFRIRNYEGNVYRAPLFPGNIQQSNALVAERYISNPISSSDRNLLADFWDDEFRGRPMDGNYTLRVYETDSFEWEKLEDVQLLLKYRYWTRFE